TRATIWHWFKVQIAVVVLLTLIFLIFQGMQFAGSVLLGGAISILPNALFARWWFAYFKAKAANRLVGKFYVGEVIKLVLTVLLFIIVLTFISWVNILAYLLGFLMAQIVFWIGPVLQLSRDSTK